MFKANITGDRCVVNWMYFGHCHFLDESLREKSEVGNLENGQRGVFSEQKNDLRLPMQKANQLIGKCCDTVL
jgi:hypothetical protein